MIGQTISRYKIIEEIGKGGIGVVYLANDFKLGRKIALKFLLPDTKTDEDFQKRFLQEAQMMATLNHPNIVTIFEAGDSNDGSFIAMEYIEGQTLDEIIKKKDLTISQAIDIACQTCEGLYEAHRAGIVHRDIKPGNIRINKNNRVKILDFGMAKLKAASKKTSKSKTLGTLFYLSPEQISKSDIDQRSDIFSFGIVLYEMITGKLPFTGQYEAAIIYSILNEKQEPLARYKSGVTEGLQRIIDKALEKKPEERYQHIDELLTDLKKEKEQISQVVQTSTSEIRKLAAIMFIDIVGFSRMMAQDEEKTLNLLHDYSKIVSPIIKNDNGNIIKKIGDGLFCEFPSAFAAVESACKIQEAFHAYNQKQNNAFILITRIGIHLGDVVRKGNDLFGDGVNVASRIEPLAPHGGICISGAIYSVIRSHPQFKINSLGLHDLKNLDQKYDIYQVKTGYELKTESGAFSEKEYKDGKMISPLGKILKNKIYRTLILSMFIVGALITIYSVYIDNQEITNKMHTDSQQLNNNSETIPAQIADFINSKKTQQFKSDVRRMRNFNDLTNYLSTNQEQGKIIFGNKSDFYSKDNKFVIIVDEKNIYSLLYTFESQFFDLYSNESIEDLAAKFKGKRSIWVELQ